MITIVALLDAWLTETTITDADGKSQTVPYHGPNTTRYLSERSGGERVECDYLAAQEVSSAREFPGVLLPPDPCATVTYAWFDARHADGLAWLKGDQSEYPILASEEVNHVGEIPGDWPQ